MQGGALPCAGRSFRRTLQLPLAQPVYGAWVHFAYVRSEARSDCRRLLGQEVPVLLEFLARLLQRRWSSADVILRCYLAPLFHALDSVGLSVCQLLYWVLCAILLVQVSWADVRQVSRLNENCSDFVSVPRAQFGGRVGGESDID
eukprot:s51_g15.t1